MIMERKIGENFTFEGEELVVLENSRLSSTFYRQGCTVCNSDCHFCRRSLCTSILTITGDCQRAQRSDNKNVYFIDAAFARSPLGSAAENSTKIVGKS